VKESKMSGQQETRPRIVVGVDGSEPSRDALRWAVTQAGLTGAGVEAVLAWHHPYLAAGYGWAPLAVMQASEFAADAEKLVTDVVSSVVDPATAVPVTARAVQGSPPRVLLDAAGGAQLLVVGSRGLGGFTEALLGSVSQHCVHHAPCPVVIIREQAAVS
jgi:nucleotide-binding universal stress UspA family protein